MNNNFEKKTILIIRILICALQDLIKCHKQLCVLCCWWYKNCYITAEKQFAFSVVIKKFV